MQAVTLQGLKWAAVAAQVPGRSDMQCRERWMNSLDPARRSGAWTQVSSGPGLWEFGIWECKVRGKRLGAATWACQGGLKSPTGL